MNISLRRELSPPDGVDEPFLRRLIVQTAAAELGADAWPAPMRAQLLGMQYTARRHSIRNRFPGGRSQIIQVDGEDAGWLFVADLADEIRLVEIMVLAERRGRGVGAAVIRQVIGEAAAAGKPLRLAVDVMNPRAIRLYERLGFRRVGGDEVQHIMEHPGA